jgi:hypothetical protein
MQRVRTAAVLTAAWVIVLLAHNNLRLRARPRCILRAAAMTEPKDRFDAMLTDYQALLPQMHDKFGHSNCPLTAEAVWKYFNTGKLVKERRTLGSQSVICSPSIKTKVTVEGVKKLLNKHGKHGVPGTSTSCQRIRS